MPLNAPSQPNEPSESTQRAQEFWQSRTARPLTSDDARQIHHNLTGFFRILLEWRKRAISVVTTASPEEVGNDLL